MTTSGYAARDHDREHYRNRAPQELRMATDITESAELGEINKYNFRTETTGVFKAQKGIKPRSPSDLGHRAEPDWMRNPPQVSGGL